MKFKYLKFERFQTDDRVVHDYLSRIVYTLFNCRLVVTRQGKLYPYVKIYKVLPRRITSSCGY